MTNSALVLEVTRPSTEDYDRGEKLRHYQSLPSLREVLMVSRREPRLTLHRRVDDGSWSTVDARPSDELAIDAVAGRLAVDDVYRDGLEDLERR